MTDGGDAGAEAFPAWRHSRLAPLWRQAIIPGFVAALRPATAIAFVFSCPVMSSPASSPLRSIPSAVRALRHMHVDDVPRVLTIQRACYAPETVEAEAVIRRRLAVAPDTAWVAENEDGVCAYLVGYRSQFGKLTPLGGDFEPIADGDSLYLHDLAVSTEAAGSGAGRALIEHAWAQGRRSGLKYSALVSVQDSRAFWQKRGYQVIANLGVEQRQRLATYAGPSYYMARELAG